MRALVSCADDISAACALWWNRRSTKSGFGVATRDLGLKPEDFISLWATPPYLCDVVGGLTINMTLRAPVPLPVQSLSSPELPL